MICKLLKLGCIAALLVGSRKDKNPQTFDPHATNVLGKMKRKESTVLSSGRYNGWFV